ncbi:hypothetical protein I4U23_011683 [Adineta vaga]|nr:hypothetical protein I4U23_011683 [Adineta vaga]
MSEDCLYVNIFTPLSNTLVSMNLLPVMLFIHGGGFQYGYATEPIYEAERLVNITNVVVALIQYRLGVLGFFATGNGPNDIKGNYGILDQRLAIAWIKANINAFEGDANECRSQYTALHYVTSEMQPFFQRAIIQSAPMTVPVRTYLEYVILGVLLAEQIHCATSDVVCFRSRSIDQIIAAQSTVNALFFFEPWLPVIDNVIVHDHLLNSVRNISFPLKPLSIGTVTDKCWSFIFQNYNRTVSASEYIAVVIALFGENAFKVFHHYPPDASDD